MKIQKLGIIVSQILLSGILAFDAGAEEELNTGTAVRLEAAGGWGSYNFDVPFPVSNEYDGTVFRGAGSVSQRYGNFALQVDIHGTAEDFSYFHRDALGGVGHLGWRDESNGALALVGGYQEADSGAGTSLRQYRIGAEGEWYWNDLTLGLAAGYLNSRALLFTRFPAGNGFQNRGIKLVREAETEYAKGHVRYYLNPNFKLELSGGGHTYNFSADNLYYVGAGLEYKLDTLPVSLFGRWNGVFLDSSGSRFSPKIDTQQALVGFKLYLGGSSDTSQHYDRAYFADSCLFQGAQFNVC